MQVVFKAMVLDKITQEVNIDGDRKCPKTNFLGHQNSEPGENWDLTKILPLTQIYSGSESIFGLSSPVLARIIFGFFFYGRLLVTFHPLTPLLCSLARNLQLSLLCLELSLVFLLYFNTSMAIVLNKVFLTRCQNDFFSISYPAK